MAVVTAFSPNPFPSDEVLLARLLRGDRSALNELFQRHREVAYRVAYRLLGNESDALDAVQDGFIKAMNHLREFEGRSSFKTWLLRVVSNAAMDQGRRRSRRDALLAHAIEHAATTPGFGVGRDPHLDAEEHDLRSALHAALEELPESQRRTFVLHVDGGLSYREIAEVMKISIGTVMSRLFYARQKLRGLLAAHVET